MRESNNVTVLRKTKRAAQPNNEQLFYPVSLRKMYHWLKVGSFVKFLDYNRRLDGYA